jgi:adenylate kinase
MDSLTVIFIGPPGSGKGTQIQELDALLSTLDPLRRVVNIQTGRRFRALAAKQETFAERKVAAALDTGVLQPDFLTHILWGQAMLDQLDPKCHLLVDGFPRTVVQAHVLEDALRFFERGCLSVINLQVPEAVARERMLKRARPDDTADSIENRLRWYRENTLPVLAHYRKCSQTDVHDINAADSVEAVRAAVANALQLAPV